MSPWLFNIYMDAVIKEEKMDMKRRRVRFLEERRQWRLPGLLYADDLILSGDSEEDLRVMVGSFVEVCRRRGQKFNAGNSKVMVLGGEEGLECEVYVNGIRLEHVSEFKYLGSVLDESDTDEAESSRRVASGRRVVCAVRSLFHVRDLQLECARVLHETLLVPVLMYGSETILWNEKERSGIRNVQMNNLRGLLGITRMDRVPNARITEL